MKVPFYAILVAVIADTLIAMCATAIWNYITPANLNLTYLQGILGSWLIWYIGHTFLRGGVVTVSKKR